MRWRRETRRARVALLLAGFSAALALPGSGGADPSGQASALRAQQASLGSRTHAALLSLYSLDSRLAQSRARAATLAGQADDARAQLTQVGQEKAIARHAWDVSVAALASHLRSLYEDGQPNAIAVVLGATSIDDALTRLDYLEQAAQMNRTTIAQTLHARATLSRLQEELASRARHLQALLAAAEQTTATLAQARVERAAYVASLTRERMFTARKIAGLDAQAQASATTTPMPTPAPAPAQAASAPIAPVTTPSPPPAAGSTLVVTATGYSLGGNTATGLPTGWGVVAVDPSVIPLGTRLTIPGYGEGVAADTGSGVQGTSIDLWFPTAAQAMAWGRRTVTITVH